MILIKICYLFKVKFYFLWFFFRVLFLYFLYFFIEPPLLGGFVSVIQSTIAEAQENTSIFLCFSNCRLFVIYGNESEQ